MKILTENNELLELVMELDDAWYRFFESMAKVEITIESVKILIPFLNKFKELKQYAGMLKK